jgi:hypothetical protein
MAANSAAMGVGTGKYWRNSFPVCPVPDNFGQILKMAAPLHQGAGLKPQTKQEASTTWWTNRQQGLKREAERK